jgi:lambda family phage portal protein
MLRVPNFPATPATTKPRIRKTVGGARKYSGARPDRLVGGFSTYTMSVSTGELLRRDLRGLVAHSRSQARDNDFLKAFFGLAKRHIIGPQGILLEPQIKDRNGEVDTVTGGRIDEKWQEWSELGESSVCGRFSWLDLQRVAVFTMARDGNLLVRLRTGKGFGRFGFQLELLSIEQLDLDKVQDLGNGRRIAGGIEFNEFGRPVAYHLWKTNPGERHVQRNSKIRVPADQILHLYLPGDASTYLGEPWAHTAVRRLNTLGQYEEAALVAARAGASKMGFIQQDLETAEMDPEAETDEDNPLPQKMAAGEIEHLPPGRSFTQFDPGYPDGEMATFVKTILRGAAAGLEVSYNSLANDLEGANFSTLRAGLGEERDNWRTLQAFVAQHFHNLIYRRWLNGAILTGELNLPMGRIREFYKVRWQPRGWPAVNPKEEANSNDLDLKNGLRAPQDIVAARGENFHDVLRKISEANEAAAELGLNIVYGQAPAAAPVATAQPPEGEDAET